MCILLRVQSTMKLVYKKLLTQRLGNRKTQTDKTGTQTDKIESQTDKTETQTDNSKLKQTK